MWGAADNKIQLKAIKLRRAAAGAALGLTSEASIDGSQILLNSPTSAQDASEDVTVEPTIIELTDLEGEPIPNQPYRLVLGDGRVLAGSVDDDGRAELIVEEGGDLFFPGLRDVEER